MTRFLKAIIWAVVSFNFMAYGAEPVLHPDVHYKIVSDEPIKNIKRSVEVTINERVDESTLAQIAKDIKALDNTPVERTFIGYRLDGQDGSYWATTNYDPDLEVKIIGSTKEDYAKLLAVDSSVPGEVMGAWLCSWGYNYKLVAYKSSGKIFIKSFYSDGPSKPAIYNIKKINSKTILTPAKPNSFGEHYQINAKGDLEFWSAKGNYYTAPKIK